MVEMYKIAGQNNGLATANLCKYAESYKHRSPEAGYLKLLSFLNFWFFTVDR